jgi:hypothetical protein
MDRQDEEERQQQQQQQQQDAGEGNQLPLELAAPAGLLPAAAGGAAGEAQIGAQQGDHHIPMDVEGAPGFLMQQQGAAQQGAAQHVAQQGAALHVAQQGAAPHAGAAACPLPLLSPAVLVAS